MSDTSYTITFLNYREKDSTYALFMSPPQLWAAGRYLDVSTFVWQSNSTNSYTIWRPNLEIDNYACKSAISMLLGVISAGNETHGVFWFCLSVIIFDVIGVGTGFERPAPGVKSEQGMGLPARLGTEQSPGSRLYHIGSVHAENSHWPSRCIWYECRERVSGTQRKSLTWWVSWFFSSLDWLWLSCAK